MHLLLSWDYGVLPVLCILLSKDQPEVLRALRIEGSPAPNHEIVSLMAVEEQHQSKLGGKVAYQN